MGFIVGFLLGFILTFFTSVYICNEIIKQRVQEAKTLKELKKYYL